ncbi:MAG: WbqC family protein [Proteobacteria bacterium]|nr:WbqC family protein [Pseudomonadota bacterium]
MPWLGFFHKVYMSEVLVFLDNVQYRRRYFQNRNKIRIKNGWQWLTVPLKKENRDELLIKDAKIYRDDTKWIIKNTDSIYHNYCKAPFFNTFWDNFKSTYSNEYQYLSELNISLIHFFFNVLGLKKDVVLASTMGVLGEKGDLIFNICKAIGTTKYVSGISGRDYLDMEKFHRNGIEVIIQEFRHPVYKQMYDPFMPCMSIIDLLFNHGDKSLDIINGVGVPVMEEIFT